MREHAEKILKITSCVLVALLLFQLVRALVRNDPFGHVIIPAVPTLAAATNGPAAGGPGAPAMPAPIPVPPNSGTNLAQAGTNQLGTSVVVKTQPTNLVANSAATNPAAQLASTNSGTNLPVVLAAGKSDGNSTNGDKLSPPLAAAKPATNSVAVTNLVSSTNSTLLAGTNLALSANAPPAAGTNQDGTNALAAAAKKPHGHHPPMMGMGGPGMGMPMMGMPAMGMGGPLPEFPPVVRSRIDQIVSSELLGPIMHPMPIGLLGIAGDDAFLRAGTGQTGLVKVGDTLGDLKLIRIGINRVLVEQNGQQQELMIFSGMGGESLLTTPDKNSNETTNH